VVCVKPGRRGQKSFIVSSRVLEGIVRLTVCLAPCGKVHSLRLINTKRESELDDVDVQSST
jgi:hypothetical protein